jgi:succinate dehydrogenase / fumarate reductase iron-sulfur subunit
MMARAEQELFGSCTNIGECEAACPKEISIDFIGRLNRDYIKASILKGSKASRKSWAG